MRKQLLSLAIIGGLGLAAASYATADVNIPVVPVDVMKKNVPAPHDAAENRGKGSGVINRDSHLVVAPGENQIVPISQGHLNRIVTPFGDPRVTTTSAATTEVRDNVVYVATEGDVPVTMFLTHSGSEAEAVSLTLVPQRIPPRELFIEMEGGASRVGLYGNSKAERWETQQPYVDTLRNLLSTIALGETPQGYSLHETQPGDPTPDCLQAGLEFSFVGGQVVAGHNLSVKVGIAQNVTEEPIEFIESSCGNWDTAAVSAWPHNVLAPSQKTEVFVVTRNEERVSSRPAKGRPSLLGGK